VVLGSYERVFWVLAAALAAVSVAVLATGTDVSREEVVAPPARG